MANSKAGSATQTGDKQHRFQQLLAQGGREGALIGLIALCVYLVMALVSHDPADPGWASIGHQTDASNYAGRSGAWISSLLFTLFGQLSYLFPLLIGYYAILIYRRRGGTFEFHWPLFLLRTGGFVLLLLSGTGLFALYSFFGLDPDSGGILGDEIGTAMVAVMNLPATTVVLVAIFLFAVTLFTGLSWMRLVDGVGQLVLLLSRYMARGVQALGGGDQQAREAARQQKADKREARRAARAEAAQNKAKAREPEPPMVRDRVEDAAQSGLMMRAWQRVTGLFRRRSEDGSVQQRKQEPVLTDESDAVPELPTLSADEPKVEKKSAAKKHSGGSDEAEAPAIKISPFRKKKQSDEGEPSKRSAREKQGTLFDDGSPVPPISLLDPPDPNKKKGYSTDSLEHMSRLLEEKLADFGVSIEVVEVNPGPVITRFEIKPAAGVKVSRITNLAKDLARSLATTSVRVVEVIPGKSVVGIEIPNEEREMVRLSEILSAKAYDKASSPLTLALGNDIGGDPVVANLSKMPHLLVAGTTGSGKSVGVNAMILSMLLKATPEEVRMIMIDPKMLELNIYEGIPHLLAPVVTDMKEAANALRWCVAEMERRYKLMSSQGVRNLAGFNRKVTEARDAGEPLKDPLWDPQQALDPSEDARPELEPLPYIVVVVDEFADMMMIVGKKVEELIARIAQKARAAGIHLILATQRPSVDVITGLIKANIPTRMSFSVQSKVDSRTVLDQGGAEQLLGNGDMLYLAPGSSMPERVHGAFVEDDEVHRVVEAWKSRGEAEYIEGVLSGGDSDSVPGIAAMNDDDSEKDALFDEAVAYVTESRRASISSVQRKFKIGYNRAANLVEAMEAAGVVSAAGHNGSREVLAAPPPKD